MEKLEKFISEEVDWVMDRLKNSPLDSSDHIYYQGRLDQLAGVRRCLNMPQVMRGAKL